MQNDDWVEWTARALVAMAVMALCWALCSCNTQYVPVQTVKYDSVFFARIQKDSIFVKDSVFVRQKGDTVFLNKYQYIYKYVGLSDTVYIASRDSIQVPFPVERKLSRWEQIKMDCGGYLVGIGFLYILYRLMRWIIKKRE